MEPISSEIISTCGKRWKYDSGGGTGGTGGTGGIPAQPGCSIAQGNFGFLSILIVVPIVLLRKFLKIF
jgi:hypothetical protein